VPSSFAFDVIRLSTSAVSPVHGSMSVAVTGYHSAILWLSRKLGVPLLPAHIHVAFASFAVGFALQYISSIVSPRIFPRVPQRSKQDWDVHVVAFVHAIWATSTATWILLSPLGERLARDKIFAYDMTAGNLFAVSLGYFGWDTVRVVVVERSDPLSPNGPLMSPRLGCQSAAALQTRAWSWICRT
jgi:hypothetical protein